MKAPQYVEVNIFGEEYKLIAKYKDKDRILKIARLIDARMDSLATRFPSYSKEKIAILTSLNLADELYKLNADNDIINERFEKLIEFIDNSLPQST